MFLDIKDIGDKVAAFGVGLVFYVAKKYQKQEFVQHLWKIPTQKLSTVYNFLDHIRIVSTRV